MTMISRLLARAALIALAVCACAYSAQAQYGMSLRFDTIVANPGDTVNLNVYYKFTSKLPQNVQDFNIRFAYDTSEIYAFDYIINGTASDSLYILDTSHQGIIVADSNIYTSHSLDFTNPILCKIRFVVKKRLADTAFIRWDTGVSVFEYSDSINVTEQNGWIRTPSVVGNVTLSTPSIVVDTDEVFTIPVSIIGVENANIDSAVLMFEVDSARLLFKEALAGAISNVVVRSVSVTQSVDTSHLDTVSIVLKAIGGYIASSDSLVVISLRSIPWYDTACVALRDIRLVALNSGSFIGNTDASSGSICVVPGSTPPADVRQSAAKFDGLVAYPNPAKDQVTFDDGSGIYSGRVTIEVYDPLGRMVYASGDSYPVWQIPSDIRAGTYLVVINTETRRLTTCLIIVP